MSVIAMLEGLEGEADGIASGLRAVDWTRSPLGPPDTWPAGLTGPLRLALTSGFPMWLAWGPELTFFCNDAFRRASLGAKYPGVLGRPAREVWDEIWSELEPRIASVLDTGRPTWDEDLMLILSRGGRREETHHTLSVSALPDDLGQVAGVLCVSTEITGRVVAERRMAVLRELGSVPAGAQDENAFVAAACTELARNPRTLPFALVYLYDTDGSARLAGASGLDAGSAAAPERIELGDPDAPWPAFRLTDEDIALVERIDERFEGLPTGGFDWSPQDGLMVSIPAPGGGAPLGFLVIGTNRFRPLDAGSHAFVSLVAQRLAAGIDGARSYRTERTRVEHLTELSLLRGQAAEQLRSERSRLVQTLRQLPAGVLLVDKTTGRPVLVNDQVAEILGRPVSDIPGSYERHTSGRWFHLDGTPVPSDDRPLVRALYRDQVVRDEELLYERPDGQRITVRASAAPIVDEEGHTFAAVLVMQDVTDRLRTERLLAGQRDVLAMIARGRPLDDTLDAIARCAEVLSERGGQVAILRPGEPGPRAGQLPSMAVPIRASDGEVVGTFAAYHERPIGASDFGRRAGELLSRLAAVAIERSRDAEARALQFADLQSSLLPGELAAVPGVSAAVLFIPGDRALEVGGDFYDLFPLSGARWGFVVGDVRGHGTQAAAVTALTRHTTRAIGRLERRPGAVLRLVSDALRDSGYDRFCTAVYGELEPVDGGAARIRLACGGHPAPLIKRASGQVDPVIARGPLLGVFDEPRFEEAEITLAPGDTLLLYTDGLIERNPRVSEENGLPALLAELGPAPVQELLDALAFGALGPEPQPRDDVAVLLLRAG